MCFIMTLHRAVVEITSDLTIKESYTLFMKLFSLNLNLIINVKGHHCFVSLKPACALHFSKTSFLIIIFKKQFICIKGKFNH